MPAVDPPRLRAALAVLATALLTSCAGWMPGGADRIVEVATGREISRAELLDAARASDFVLLGELHDNPAHHVRRGELIAALGPGTVVAAEHLPRGGPVDLSGDMAAALAEAGFDRKGWDWPIHEPLFDGVRRAGATLVGANAPRDVARQVAREGETAIPADARAALDAAPLATDARAALEEDLVRGHCGHLGGARLANTVWAQRTRDATMWLALAEAAARPGARRPAVLVAGNGHARTDYGVPQLIARQRPAARVLSLGMLERGATVAGTPYTHVWITHRASRKDPCASMPHPPPAATTAAARGERR